MNPPANAGDTSDTGLISGSGRSPGEGSGNPLQYSYLQNCMDRGAWRAIVHGVAELDMTECTHTHTHTHTTWWNVHEIPIVWDLGAFQVGWTHPLTGRVRHASSMGTEVPVLRTLPDLGLHISSSGCSSVSFIISFNTLVNISKCSWVLWAVLGNNWI